MTTFVLLSTFVCAAAPTAAEGLADELARGLSAALAGAPVVALLTGIEDASGSGAAAALTRELEQALAQKGVRLVDKKALEGAVAESALHGGDASALGELAGAAGARVVLSGRVARLDGGLRAEVRAIDVTTGKLLVTATAALGEQTEPLARGVTVEGQLRRLSDAVAAGLSKLPGEARYERFAVLPFEEIGATTRDKQLGLLVSSELTTLLSRDHGLMLVERAQLARVIDELSLGQSGLTDPAQSAEVGKLAGAEGLIVGSVSEVGDHYTVDARVVGASEARVVHSAQVGLPAADLVALSSEAVVLRTRSGAVYRSLLIPGWGQSYNREPIKSGLFAAAEVLGAGAALWFHLEGRRRYDTYRGLDASAAPEEFPKRLAAANDAYGTRDLLLWGVVAVHALNVLDALVSGKTYDSASLGGD